MKRIFSFASRRRALILFTVLLALVYVYVVVRPQRRITLSQEEARNLVHADVTQRFDQVVAQLQQHILREPNNPRWRQELAKQYLQLRLWMDAAETLEDAVQAGDNDAFTLSALGDAYRNLNNREQAILWFKKNLKAHPNDLAAYFRLSNIYAEMGDREWGLDVLSHIPAGEVKSETLVPLAVAYGKLEDYATAYRLAEQRLKTAPQDVEALWTMGKSASHLDQWEKAEAVLEKGIQSDPKRADFYHLLGICRARLAPEKVLEQAVPLWIRAIELNPGLSGAYYEMAAAYEKAGHLAEASRAYLRAYESPPQPLEALNDMARVYRKMHMESLSHKAKGLYCKHQGDAQRAIREFEARLKLEPRNELAYLDMAEAYQGGGKLQEAVEVLKRGLGQAKNSSSLYFALAKAYKAQMKVNEEEAALQNIVQSGAKESEYAYRELSRIAFENKGEYDRAEAMIHKAIALNPKEPDYSYTLGVIYSMRITLGGRREKAIDAFREALTLQPTHVDAAYQLGLLLQKSERWEEAAAHFRAAISLSPSFGDPYLKLYEIYRRQNKAARAETLMRLYQDYQRATADRERLQREARARPNDPAAAEALGTFYLRNGHFSSAESEFRRMSQLAPRADKPYLRLAELYALLGRTQDETEALKSARKNSGQQIKLSKRQ